MPRTATLKPEQVPANSKPTLDTFTKNIGFTPNMMATFALSPIAFNSWAALLGSLSKALDVKTRDSIGLTVSEVNGCNYCLTAHSFTASIWPSCRPMKYSRSEGPRQQPEAGRRRPVCAQSHRDPRQGQ
jgi:alkylhydroperoxidase family enzyme